MYIYSYLYIHGYGQREVRLDRGNTEYDFGKKLSGLSQMQINFCTAGRSLCVLHNTEHWVFRRCTVYCTDVLGGVTVYPIPNTLNTRDQIGIYYFCLC